MASTLSGRGYWLVAGDGGMFVFGDAAFQGSLGGTHLAAPIVAASTAMDGSRYWLVPGDGGVFTFGVPFFGSLGGTRLVRPVVGSSD
jgi:hypothetical protein